jgi:hypothetical protein
MKLHELKQIIREEIEKELSSKPEGMKVEDLELYGTYKNTRNLKKELIYIGIGNNGFYFFIYKNENANASFLYLKYFGLNPDKIVNELNLEIYFNKNGDKFIKGYDWISYSKEYIEIYLKPL